MIIKVEKHYFIRKCIFWKSLDWPVHALGAGTGPEYFQPDPVHRSLVNIKPWLQTIWILTYPDWRKPVQEKK